MNLKSNSGNFLLRTLTAAVLIPVVFSLVLIPELRWGLVLFVALLASVGLWEYFGFTRALKLDAMPALGIIFGVLLTLSGALRVNFAVFYGPMLSVGAVLCLASVYVFSSRNSLVGLAATILGVMYVGGCSAHLLMLHRIEPKLVFFLLATIILSDTGAYIAGKNFGRHKLAPKVSPKKTWEGAIGGLLCAALGAVIMFYCSGNNSIFPGSFPLWAYALVATALAAAGQIGDLAESMLKRDAGIKDSGNLFPGHGGVLDRCDGILFAAPVLYYVALFGFMIEI
jgi:phosphatidate cytidylyltransferase